MNACAKARRIANKPRRRQVHVRRKLNAMLEQIRIVLVETTHPGNIGGAARAMKNMGLARLLLVIPQYFPHAEATARASGADDLLAAAELHPTLDAALAGCSLVFGTTARGRSIPWPAVDPRGAAQRALAAAPQGPVAIVFGREHSGLSNEELDRCNYLLLIPTNPDYSSLNLAAAVQVIAYELRMATQQCPVMPTDSTPLASFQERELFYGHLEEVLMELQFLDPNNPKHLMRRLRRLFNRVGLDQKEINILRGILTAVQRRGRTSLREDFWLFVWVRCGVPPTRNRCLPER